MKAVVLVGGYSNRFYPYSKAGHKTMVKIMGKPILQYTLEGLKQAGITDIILRVSEDEVIKNYFGNGSKFGLSIKYIAQKEALGMGEVLLNAKKFLDGDFILISGNHVNSKHLVEDLLTNKKPGSKGSLLVKHRDNPWEYGIVETENGRLVEIVEKPTKEEATSSLGLVSAFLLPSDIIPLIENVPMSEYNFEDIVLGQYAKDNEIDVLRTKTEVLTLKYPWDLLAIKNYLMSNMQGKIDKSAKISESAEIDSNVIVEAGAKILEGAKIKGPSFIGKNAVIGTNSLIRANANLEENVSVGAFTEVKNSLIGCGTTIHSGFIGDSIIGQNCRIGTGFTTANRKIDRSSIEVLVKDQKVDTGLTSFGVIIGDSAKIGIKVSTMPGVVIGNNTLIGPSTSVFKNIEDDSKYYTKFSEVIEKK